MKRAWLYFLGLILIIIAGAAVFLAAKDTKNHDDQVASQTSSPGRASHNKACQIFTLAEAKSLLGSSTKGGTNSMPQSSTDLDISTCTYSQGDGAMDRETASLLVRSPKTGKGATSNTNEFGPLRPATVQDVAGYGDGAYWDIEHGQLNILKNDNWYILSFGAASPSARSLDQTRQLADLLIDKL